MSVILHGHRRANLLFSILLNEASPLYRTEVSIEEYVDPQKLSKITKSLIIDFSINVSDLGSELEWPLLIEMRITDTLPSNRYREPKSSNLEVISTLVDAPLIAVVAELDHDKLYYTWVNKPLVDDLRLAKAIDYSILNLSPLNQNSLRSITTLLKKYYNKVSVSSNLLISPYEIKETIQGFVFQVAKDLKINIDYQSTEELRLQIKKKNASLNLLLNNFIERYKAWYQFHFEIARKGLSGKLTQHETINLHKLIKEKNRARSELIAYIKIAKSKN